LANTVVDIWPYPFRVFEIRISVRMSNLKYSVLFKYALQLIKSSYLIYLFIIVNTII